MSHAPESVLLTRPEPGLSTSAALLRQHGLRVRCLPLLRIAGAVRFDTATLRQAQAAHWLIFTSRNAVRFAPDWRPPPARCAAVGPGTAEALAARGWPVDLLPQGATSESLLAAPELATVAGQGIVVVGGSGGRRTLAAVLRARGARVDKLITYRRETVDWSAAELQVAVQDRPVAVFTSGAALRHWDRLARAAGLPAARELDLVVGSQRLCKLARRLGFRQSIEILAQMSDTALLSTLQAARRPENWQAND